MHDNSVLRLLVETLTEWPLIVRSSSNLHWAVEELLYTLEATSRCGTLIFLRANGLLVTTILLIRVAMSGHYLNQAQKYPLYASYHTNVCARTM